MNTLAWISTKVYYRPVTKKQNSSVSNFYQYPQVLLKQSKKLLGLTDFRKLSPATQTDQKELFILPTIKVNEIQSSSNAKSTDSFFTRKLFALRTSYQKKIENPTEKQLLLDNGLSLAIINNKKVQNNAFSFMDEPQRSNFLHDLDGILTDYHYDKQEHLVILLFNSNSN